MREALLAHACRRVVRRLPLVVVHLLVSLSLLITSLGYAPPALAAARAEGPGPTLQVNGSSSSKRGCPRAYQSSTCWPPMR
jgi:hypothetical protein